MRAAAVLLAALLAACDGDFSVGGGGVMLEGKPAPAVHTAKLSDVGGDMSKLTSYRYPDPGMYRYSFDEALKLHKPIVLEFATPAHCTQCDQQLQLLKVLMKKYGDKVVFLHMDQYYNPQAYTAFQVRGEPWTFIVDAKGTVVRVFPGRTLYQELDPELAKLTGAKPTHFFQDAPAGAAGHNG